MKSTVEPHVLAASALQSPVTAARGEASTSRISWLWHLLNLGPFILLAWFVSRFSVKVPIMDDWWLADLFHAVWLKKATLNDFFALNNEHRIVFPKLIWTGLAFATHGNVKAAMMFNLLLVLVTFAAFYRLALRQARQVGSVLLNPANFVTSLFLFCLMQYENWLWGFGTPFLLVQASFALAIAICFVERLRLWTRFCLAAFLCFIASFSAAQGLFSWVALLPCIAQLQAAPRKAGKFYVWVFLFAASAALYSYHFKSPAWSAAAPAGLLSHPWRSALFFVALLGAPFCQSGPAIPPSAACLVGSVILFALLGCLVFLRGSERKDVIAPWLSVALFGLLFTTMVTVGRGNLGLGVATPNPRLPLPTVTMVVKSSPKSATDSQGAITSLRSLPRRNTRQPKRANRITLPTRHAAEGGMAGPL